MPGRSLGDNLKKDVAAAADFNRLAEFFGIRRLADQRKIILFTAGSRIFQQPFGAVNNAFFLIAGNHPGIETKRIVSYLPDKMYLGSWMRVSDLLTYYSDFFEDFDMSRANAMLESLKISPKDRLKTMSKGTKEKVQLILTMSRRAKLYCLDEPIAGVDPAARDYILSTILNNYEPDASILISTHLISDVENILDEVIFIQEGQLKLHASVEDIRMQEGESIDSYFREVFKC